MDGTISPEVSIMIEPLDFRDHPNVVARAEPDDEYDVQEPSDPNLIDEDDEDINDEDELDEDEV
jgi:hypothetical protein